MLPKSKKFKKLYNWAKMKTVKYQSDEISESKKQLAYHWYKL